MRAAASLLALGLASCASVPTPIASTPAVSVTARGETEPVGTADADAADDPAIWRNPANPAASLIVATDKKAGLYVYGLDGRVRYFDPAGKLNNVDLIETADGRVLVAASDRNDPLAAKLRLYWLDTTAAKLVAMGTVPAGAGEAYGVCLWRDGEQVHAFSVLKAGLVQQVRIDIGSGAPTGETVRTLRVASQPEGCVVDPRSASLYLGEEDVGIWRFSAHASAPTGGDLVARADQHHLVADVEGLALAPQGDTGGYLIASSQGDNAYALYRLPDMKRAGRFRVVQGAFGGTEETDGIALAVGSFGANYPEGLLVIQDGHNLPAAQNFKLVSWKDVLSAVNSR